MKPICISIGGLDPSGGAGILLDIKVFSELKVRGFAVGGILTEQTTDKVYSTEAIPDEVFYRQIVRLFQNYQISGIKIGLISASQISILLGLKEFYDIPNRIIDPILRSSSGYQFISVEEILPLVNASTLVLPNYQEALEFLEISDPNNLALSNIIERFKREISCKSILLKGGHLGSSTDILFTEEGGIQSIPGPEAKSSMDVHGTGCLLSSAITAQLAKGLVLNPSIEEAKIYLSKKLDTAEQLAGDKKFSFSFE